MQTHLREARDFSRVRLHDVEDQVLITNFGRRINNMCDDLGGMLDPQAAELATQLAEACYKEGYLDGCRITDWMHRSVE